jgi:hypothetical protein
MRTQQTLGLAALTTLLSAGGVALAREKPPVISTRAISCLAFDSMEECERFCRAVEAAPDRTCYIKDGWAIIQEYILWFAAPEPGAFEPAVLDPGVGVGVEIDEGGGVLTLQAEDELVVSWEAADGAAESHLGATVELAVGPGDRVTAVFLNPTVGGVVQLSLL